MKKQDYLNNILSYEIAEFLPVVNEVQLVYTRPQTHEMKQLTNSEQAYNLLKAIYPQNSLNHHEFCYVLYINSSKHVLAVGKISEGGITGTVVDMRLVFQHALLLNASAIILSHNHPSGNLKPSGPDKILTQKILEAGKLLDINLIDHIIVCEEGYYSFADDGLI